MFIVPVEMRGEVIETHQDIAIKAKAKRGDRRETKSVDQSFKISPHLVCLEKTALGLRFSHFGNVFFYETASPDRALEILQQLRRPATLSRLAAEIDCGTDEIEFELDHLIARSYVYKVPHSIESIRAEQALRFLVSSPDELKMLTARIVKATVGIIDFVQCAPELTDLFKKFGLTKISAVNPSAIEADLLEQHDFYLVLGEPKGKFDFSRVNQVLFRAKKPWLLVTLDLYGGIIGPTFGIPGGPCFDCILDHSRRHYDHRFQGSDFKNLIEKESESTISELPLGQNVLPVVVIETIKVLSQMLVPMTYDGFYSFDYLNFRMNYCNIAPSPTCPVCSGFMRDKR